MSDELLEVYQAETARQLELYPDRPLGRIMRKVEQRIDTDARRIAELEGEVDRLREAVTPSTETKRAYMGEFSVPLPEIDENGDEYIRRINIPWTEIKKVMKMIETRAKEATDAE